MIFRTAGAIAALSLGLGGGGGQALAQYYPPAQAYPSQGYPSREPLPSVADGDDDAPPINAPVVRGSPLPPIGVDSDIGRAANLAPAPPSGMLVMTNTMLSNVADTTRREFRLRRRGGKRSKRHLAAWQTPGMNSMNWVGWPRH